MVDNMSFELPYLCKDLKKDKLKIAGSNTIDGIGLYSMVKSIYDFGLVYPAIIWLTEDGKPYLKIGKTRYWAARYLSTKGIKVDYEIKVVDFFLHDIEKVKNIIDDPEVETKPLTFNAFPEEDVDGNTHTFYYFDMHSEYTNINSETVYSDQKSVFWLNVLGNRELLRKPGHFGREFREKYANLKGVKFLNKSGKELYHWGNKDEYITKGIETYEDFLFGFLDHANPLENVRNIKCQ